jgi:hypothetical protein
VVRQSGPMDDPHVHHSSIPGQDPLGKCGWRAKESKLPSCQVLCPGWNDGKRGRSPRHFGSQRTDRAITPHRDNGTGSSACRGKVSAGRVKG